MDDINIACNNTPALTSIHQLGTRFSIKDLEDIYYILGVEIHYSSFGLLLSQHKYMQDILEHVGMSNDKAASTPWPLNPPSLLATKLLLKTLKHIEH